MNYTIDQIRSLLAHNQTMQGQAKQGADRIRESSDAETRRIDEQMQALRGEAFSDPAKADEYQRLALQRGQLGLIT